MLISLSDNADAASKPQAAGRTLLGTYVTFQEKDSGHGGNDSEASTVIEMRGVRI